MPLTLPFHPDLLPRGTKSPVDSKFPVKGGSLGKKPIGKCIDKQEALEWFLNAEPIGAMKGGDEGPMKAMMNKGEAKEAATADPPLWEPNGNLIPGSRCVNVAASPCTTFKLLGEFFRSQLATEVDDQDAWAMTITAFLDYVAVNMKVGVHRDSAADSHAVVVFQHTSHDDLVQFNHVCSLALKCLSTSSLQVSELLGGVRSPSLMLSDDDFEDDLFEDEEDWPVMLGSAFEAVSGKSKSMREQGIQAVARWAEQKRDCIPALTDSLIEHGALVGDVLRGPLAESYPMAVAVKLASCCPQEAERLAEKVLPLLPWPNSVQPYLVARELEEAFKSLITAAVAGGKGTSKAVEDFVEPPALFQDDDSPTSTCTGGPWGSSWSESSKSSTWDSRQLSQASQWARNHTTEALVLSEGDDDFKGEALVLSECEDDFTGDFI